MTNGEIKIKIAESLGRRNTPFGEPVEKHPRTWRTVSDLPNYPESLDACAEFEATLTADGLQYKFREHLASVCETHCYNVALISATARQRCLAYLKTKGLIP